MKTGFLISLFLLMVVSLQAQQAESVSDTVFWEETKPPKYSLGINFDVGIPLNDFNDNVNRLAWGFSGSFLVRTNPKSRLPVLAGIKGGLMIYDSESQDQIIFIDGFSVDARLITRNSIFNGYGVLRFLPPVSTRVQPYFDGLIGFKNLYTRTTIEDRDAFEDDTIETYIEQGDWAFSFGGALGVQILLGGDEEVYILLDAKCAFLKGNAADYLVRIDDPNIQIIDTIDAFEEKNSTTDMLIPQIGLTFVF